MMRVVLALALTLAALPGCMAGGSSWGSARATVHRETRDDDEDRRPSASRSTETSTTTGVRIETPTDIAGAAGGYRGESLELVPGSLAEGRPVEGEARAGAGGERLATADSVGESVGEDVASDATPGGPLLVYTAAIWLAVYEVRESQAAISERAAALGGFVQRQTDTEIVVRVPAAQFFALVDAAAGIGDLLHREIAADDVSEEYRDVDIRIRNLEAMRSRLEELLARATAVEDALRIEQELERVTLELESLRGRQRFLADRIALATLTIHFEARPRDRIDQPEVVSLPFPWLGELGLPRLLELR